MSYRFEVARREVQRLEAKLQALRDEGIQGQQGVYAELFDRLIKARIEEARWRP